MEIGCGTGFVLSAVREAFPQLDITGSEIFSCGLSCAQGRVPDVELIQLDARKLPYAEHFDLIGAFDVLEHIEEDEHTIEQIFRALRPGGHLMLTVPQHEWLWSHQDVAAHHCRRYQAAQLRRKLSDAGFIVEREVSFITLLLPAMLASRRLRGSNTQVIDPLSELRLPAALNALFGGIMSLELLLLRLGFRFPAGGSLLAVARKV
jgi:trans-aconitate methyltransferase